MEQEVPQASCYGTRCAVRTQRRRCACIGACVLSEGPSRKEVEGAGVCLPLSSLRPTCTLTQAML